MVFCMHRRSYLLWYLVPVIRTGIYVLVPGICIFFKYLGGLVPLALNVPVVANTATAIYVRVSRSHHSGLLY